MTKIEYTIGLGCISVVISAYWDLVRKFDPDEVQAAGEKVAKGMGGSLLYWHSKEAT